jgi:N-acetylmuramoyl-L-alanine amidase
MRSFLIAVAVLFSILICQGASIGAERISKKLGLKIKTIYLDPAYGGKENGPRLSKDKLGKNITLEIAQQMKAILETKGFAVYLSRSDDTSVPPDTRVAQSRARKSDLYIGIKVTAARKDCISILTEPKPIRTHQTSKESADDPSKGLNDILSALSAHDKHEESLAIAGTFSKTLSESDLFSCVQLLRSIDYVLLNTAMPAVTVDFVVSPNQKNQPYILDAVLETSAAQILSDAIKEYADDRAPRTHP